MPTGHRRAVALSKRGAQKKRGGATTYATAKKSLKLTSGDTLIPHAWREDTTAIIWGQKRGEGTNNPILTSLFPFGNRQGFWTAGMGAVQ